MPNELIAYLVILLLIALFLLPNIHIVRENEHLLVERLGSFFKVIDKPGIYFLIPLFDRVIEKESILPQKRSLKGPHSTLVYTYKVTDIKMYGYFALDPIKDLENYFINKMEIGQMNLDDLINPLRDRGIELLDIQEVTNNNF